MSLNLTKDKKIAIELSDGSLRRYQSGITCHEIAKEISEKSLPALIMAKDAINASYETSLTQGIIYERRLFRSTFSLADQKEGMQAFIEKRKAKFKNS